MRYIKFQDIDKEKWDKMVLSSSNPQVYMLSWYQDISCKSWNIVIWDDYEAGIPLHVKSFLGLKYVAPSLLVQQTGIIYPSGYDYKYKLKEFFESSLYKRFIRLGIGFHSKTSIPAEVLPLRTSVITKKNYVLSLNKPFDILFKSYNENRRRNLKKAEKAGWKCLITNEIDSAIEMYLANQALKQENLKDTYRIIRELYNKASALEMAELYKCVSETGENLSYCLFIRFNKKIYYLFGTMNQEGKKYSAMSCIFNEVIRQNSDQDLTLDFEGGNLENIGNYFSSFGAVSEDYSFVWKKLF